MNDSRSEVVDIIDKDSKQELIDLENDDRNEYVDNDDNDNDIEMPREEMVKKRRPTVKQKINEVCAVYLCLSGFSSW